MIQPVTPNYGANDSDWAHFSMVLGLTADLLPVVSNPNAKISESSKMKELGKTPSQYIGVNGSRTVVGIPGWTAKLTNDDEVDAWSSEPDLGICLQTRTVRAIDIDITDQDQATAIEEVVRDVLGVLPKRFRSNSSKSAFLLSIDGELPKRKLVTEHGIIEFLANGQQMIVSGTHPSGERYQWQGGLPDSIPVVTIDQFNTCWSVLAGLFATEAEVESRATGDRKRGPTIEAPDEVASWLRTSNKVIGNDKSGALIIKCPWDAEHSTGSVGDGSTVWFPAGTNGYDMGHFRCLHGHCDHRTDAEFIREIGMPVLDEVDVFDVVVRDEGSGEMDPLPNFSRTRDGAIKATLPNLRMALTRFDVCGAYIAYDTFEDAIVIKPPYQEWRPFNDDDATALRIVLEQTGFAPIGKELMRDCVSLVASGNKFDSAIDWLRSLKWDGIKRIEMFNHELLGAEDTPYSRALSMYMWTALAGRVLVPGIKADIAPIWQSDTQGEGKSSTLAALVPVRSQFCEISLHENEDTLARKMRGKLVVEMSEMDGLKHRDQESIKKFLSSSGHTVILKFKEHSALLLRRCLAIGTTNDRELLNDPTGSRRLAPIEVKNVKVDAIRELREQLWAEGAAEFEANGIAYKTLESLMKPEHEKFRMTDSWDPVIQDWLYINDPLTGEIPAGMAKLTTSYILRNALGFNPNQMSKVHEMRVGKAMINLGFKNTKRMINGVRNHVWIKNDA